MVTPLAQKQEWNDVNVSTWLSHQVPFPSFMNIISDWKVDRYLCLYPCLTLVDPSCRALSWYTYLYVFIYINSHVHINMYSIYRWKPCPDCVWVWPLRRESFQAFSSHKSMVMWILDVYKLFQYMFNPFMHTYRLEFLHWYFTTHWHVRGCG